MDIFHLRQQIIDQYAAYTRSFLPILDSDIRAFVDTALAEGRLWPDALVHMRRELAIDAPCLDPERQPDLVKRVSAALKEPWAFAEEEVPGTAAVLPTVLPPVRPSPPAYRLRYTLVPQVARRRDVAAYFPNTEITYHDDGGAEVTATVTNLWQARQILLRYGDACQVHEPAELVALFRKTAQGLIELYGAP